MSLDRLRESYDEVVATTRSGTKKVIDVRAKLVRMSSLPYLGNCLLCMVGHRQFGSERVSQCLAVCGYAILPTACTVPLLCVADVFAKWNFTLILTLCCFQLGVSFASHSLKNNGLDIILGPRDHQLDDYAIDSDFMPDWQRLSRRRLIETLGTYVVLLLVVVMVNIFAGEFSVSNAFGPEGWQAAWYFEGVFWLMLFRYLMLCYSILHVSSGFELALDSFALTFFKDMDIEEAIEEWNILQATLRQVSTKLSNSLFVMGLCCLISMALLAEQVIFNADEVSANMLGWALKFYPTVLFFLYTLIRAAAVTEKVNRVAPLVNSWKFQEVDPLDDDDEQNCPWMDRRRHYVVQYIMQSRAGFYFNGSPLTFPDVRKLVYYFGAVSFALTSRLLA